MHRIFRMCRVTTLWAPKQKLWCRWNDARFWSSKVIDEEDAEGGGAAEPIRNIGIMAHIDAGKTTTTERMLFYSGFSRVIGEVDRGNTVMDYMDQERERGITITSAAITFHWMKHRINLIDTPGHVDFTMEVERSLKVLDGAVAILDASAGVEAQSLTVWRQADKYMVPRIIYLNKMDKPKANFQMCLKSVTEQLKAKPLMTQLPIYANATFTGVVDLVHMTRFEWGLSADRSGNRYTREPLTESKQGESAALWENAFLWRQELIDALADMDDRVAEHVLESGEGADLPGSELEMALRRVTLERTGIPVFCGSSYRNVGVQPLLDAVLKYLPSPEDRGHDFVACYGDDLCALAFKTVHDKQKGRLTFVRIYSGSIKQGQSLYNVGRQATDKVGKLMIAFADDFRDTRIVRKGNIAVISGLKSVVTGDVLVTSQKTAQIAEKAYAKKFGHQKRISSLGLVGIQAPQPVFFCSIEPVSLSHQTPLEQALECLQIEDPSLHVKVDSDTGQMVISGMGELHIEIIKDRLLREYKVEAYLGPLQVAYHETVGQNADVEHVLSRTLADRKHHVAIRLAIAPQPEEPAFLGLRVAREKESRENYDAQSPDHLKAIESGVQMALSHGSLLGYPVTNVSLCYRHCEVRPGTSKMMVSAAAAQCTTQLLANAGPRLLEPIMAVEIVTDERNLHSVLADLSQRRSQIVDVHARLDAKIVLVMTPLAEMVGYSTALRTITSGTAVFTMEFASYQLMASNEQQKAIQKVTGFAPV